MRSFLFVVAAIDRSSAVCTNTPGQDCVGQDLSNVPGYSVDDCCNACQDTNGCGAYVFVSGGTYANTCYLKSRCDATGGCAGGGVCTAGEVAAPTPVPVPTPVPTPVPSPTPSSICNKQPGQDCAGQDISNVPGNSADDCCLACQTTAGCRAYVFVSGGTYTNTCFLKSGCLPKSGCTAGGQCTAGALPPPPPSPPPPPTPGYPGSGCYHPDGWNSMYDGNNPLGIVPKPQRSDNYFLIIGDWGKSGGPGPCQNQVMALMKQYVRNQAAAGKKCLFIGAVGDNFYWTGQTGDWSTQWANVYGTNDPNSELFDIPFLAVMGNHDFGVSDSFATCPSRGSFAQVGPNTYGARQFNKDKNPSRPDWTSKYWMPDYNYHYEIPEVGLELIGVDQSATDLFGLGGGSSDAHQVFNSCGGQANTESFLNLVKQSGEDMLRCRAQLGTASTVVILQHYPGSGKQVKDIFDAGVPANRTVSSISAYGHAHQQHCDGRNDGGQCDLILTGGGGGCCSSDIYGGFTAVHLTDDGGFTSDVESGDVLVGGCAWAAEDIVETTV